MTYLTSDLITAVRRKGRIPDSVPDYTDAVILAEADDVISSYMTEALSSLRNGYWVVQTDTALTVGTSAYEIPTDCTGDSLEGVYLVDSTGREQRLAHVPISDSGTIILSSTSTGTPRAFCLRDSDIVLLPTPNNASVSLRVRFMQRRGRLVPVTSCAAISAKDVGAGTVTTATQPSLFLDDAYYDIARSTPPFRRVVSNALVDNIAGSGPYVFTFDTQPVTAVQTTGIDYLCLTGETCVIQLPVELHSALALMTAGAILGQMGYAAQESILMQRGQSVIAAFQNLAIPRVKEQLFKVVNRNSTLRIGRVW